MTIVLYFVTVAASQSTVAALGTDTVMKCTNGSNQNQELLQEASDGNVQRVKYLVYCNGTNINNQDDEGRTPLYIATLKNHTQVVKLLLGKEGIDINLGTTHNEETALIVAATHGQADIVELLLDNKMVDVNKGLITTGLTPLIAASQIGHYKIVKMLTDHSLILVNKALITSGDNSLVVALKNGHNGVVALLLNHTDIDVNIGPKNGKTPLIIAASNVNSTDSVRKILTKPGVDVNKQIFDGETALFMAVTSNHFDAVELLLRCPKTDTELLDENYKTAKEYATEGNLNDIVEAFETRGALTNEKGHSCCSGNVNRGLIMAVEVGDLTWIKTFLQCPQIDINVRNQHGITPLNVAAREGYNAIARLLLSNPKIDTNKYNSMNGKTALFFASEEGKWEIVKMLLLNAQIDVEIPDINGMTAVQKAAYNRHLMAVKLLLRCPKTKIGDIENENDDIQEAIEMRSYLINVGLTCCLNVADGLLQAAIKGYYREIKGLLLCPYANSNVNDRKGQTPLYLASLEGHGMSVQVLLADEHIDADIGRTLDGGTAFSIASEKGHFNVMQQLISHGNKVHASVLNKGWCSDNWTPQRTMCSDAKETTVTTTTQETGRTDSGKLFSTN